MLQRVASEPTGVADTRPLFASSSSSSTSPLRDRLQTNGERRVKTEDDDHRMMRNAEELGIADIVVRSSSRASS